MANFASLRGPVGLNRVYVKVPAGPLNIENLAGFAEACRTFNQRTFAGILLGGKQLGDEVSCRPRENKMTIHGVAAIGSVPIVFKVIVQRRRGCET